MTKEVEKERLSDFTERLDSFLKFLGLNAENLVGLVWAGLAFWCSLRLIAPYTTNKEIASLISANSTAEYIGMILFFGGITFIVYKRVIGEIFLYPCQHYLHKAYDYIAVTSGREEKSTSPVWMMREFGVRGSVYSLRRAYSDTKDEYFPKHGDILISLTHGELHVMYIAALFLLINAVLLNYSVLFFVLGAMVFCVSLIADTREHISESRIFKKHKVEIIIFLKERNHIIYASS